MGEGNVEDETFEAGPGASLDRVVGVEGGTQPEPAEEWAAHGPQAAPEAAEHAHSEHSPWPVILALGLFLFGLGLLTQMAVAALGVVVVLVATIAWMWEPWTS